MKTLVTGAAGFIGFSLTKKLLERGDEVIGLDCINDYYDINLKYARLQETGIERKKIFKNKFVQSTIYPNYKFIQLHIEDKPIILNLFKSEKFDNICNLAAQAGVRYSLVNPDLYIKSNIEGFFNILEACRHYHVKHLVYASSSSVYGLNETMPFTTNDNADHPISLYAASKKSNELMAHTYSHLFGVPTTGLRLFTVYGPWGRPDMALFLFTKAILEGRGIDVYNNGEMLRDFTYIDDIVNGIIRVIDSPPSGQPGGSGKNSDKSIFIAPYKLFNIGNSKPVKILDFINEIEAVLAIKAKINFLPMQAGDVPATWADITDLTIELGYMPEIDYKTGIEKFIHWYRHYYKV